MFANYTEESLIKSLINSNKTNQNKVYLFEWSNDLIIDAKIECFYETDNELNINDVAYFEYYVCVIEITKILQNKLLNFEKTSGDFIEICYKNIPTKITTENGETIWEITS